MLTSLVLTAYPRRDGQAELNRLAAAIRTKIMVYPPADGIQYTHLSVLTYTATMFYVDWNQRVAIKLQFSYDAFNSHVRVEIVYACAPCHVFKLACLVITMTTTMTGFAHRHRSSVNFRRARHFIMKCLFISAWKYIWKINKMPEFYIILPDKIPEFYTVITRKIFFPDFFFLGGGLPPSPTPMVLLSFLNTAVTL